MKETTPPKDSMHAGGGNTPSGDILMRIARNSLFVLVARGTDLVVAMLSTMIIARYLGIIEFGNFAIVTTISLFLGPVVDFGFERIITREIAKDRENAGRYLGAAVVTRVIFSLLILALLAATTTWLVRWDPRVVGAIYLSTFAQLFTSMGMLAVGTFRAFERMEIELALNFAVNIVYIGLLGIVILFDGGFTLLFVARFVASLAQMIILLSVVTRRFVKPVITFDRQLLTHMFREAAPLGIFAILLTAVFRMDVFVLNYFKGPLDVSMFDASHRIIMQIQILPMSIMIALFPFISAVASRSDEALRSSYGRAFKIMLIISLPLPIIMTLASNAIIFILYGASFAQASASLSILSWTLPFLFFILLQTFVMTAYGKQGLNTISAAVGFIVNLALDILLVPSYGFVGASYATLISYALLFVLTYYFLAKTVGVPPLGDVVGKPLLAAAVMGGVAFLLHGWAKGPFVAVSAGFALLCYAVALYALKAFRFDEIETIKCLLSRKRKRGPQVEEA